MTKKKLLQSALLASALVLVALFLLSKYYQPKQATSFNNSSDQNQNNQPRPAEVALETVTDKKAETDEIIFVGPRGNLPEDAPTDYGFWSFAIPAPGILSRSGQPTLAEFQWLKANGWKSNINLRIDGDHTPEVSDDAKIPGFKELGLNYLKIQMADGAAPTNAQVEDFLNFVTQPENQPAHVHCRGGMGRTGIMVVLYRYAVQNWPLEKAIEESRLFQGGISDNQLKWVKQWAADHPAGSWNK